MMPDTAGHDATPVVAGRLAVATALFATTVQQSLGTLSAVGLLGLLLIVVETQAVLWGRTLFTGRAAALATGAAVMLQGAVLAFDPALQRGAPMLPALLLAACAITCGALSMRVSPAQRTALVAILASVVTAYGIWVIVGTPRPGIDVLLFQRESAAALLHGVNPYTIEFRDPYPPALSAQFYGAGVSVDGMLKFGYPYMPLTLLLSLPGHLLGDARFASLAAVVLAALCLHTARPSRQGTGAALLLLSTPIFPRMLYGGWTDTVVVLLVAVCWWCHHRAPRLLPYAAGLLLASKQYMVIAVPVLLLMVPRPWTVARLTAFGWRATLTACVVTLPLVLWNLEAFMQSAVWLQFRQPFRSDALSFLVWLSPAEPRRWTAVPFALSGLAWLGIFLRHRRAPVAPALALAIVMLVFFATNKQAFLNYYFLVVACCCCAVAALGEPDDITAPRGA